LALQNGLSLPEDLHIHCQNNIPIASGLGSSASAVISGLVGARKILNLNISDQKLIQTAAQIEGHADNASACLYGGFILVGNDNGLITINQLQMKSIIAVVAVPEFSFSTELARKVLPEVVQINDAVFNIQRTVELVHILEKGNFELLNTAMQDRLHQDHRLPLLPGSKAAMQSAIDTGAYGVCLSGAGPSVIAFTNQENAQAIGNAMINAYKDIALPARSYILSCPANSYFLT